MKRGKVLSLVLATSISLGSFLGMGATQQVFAEDMPQVVSNSDENSSDESKTIDTSSFDSQQSFTGESEAEQEQGTAQEESVDTQSSGRTNYSFIASRVSQDYYNFNISGAEKYTYGTSGNGRSLYYYKIGSGDKVLFLNFGIHGYEDAWSKDGEELTKLAKDLIQRLANQNASGGLNGWTVVVVPSSNPDGVLDGWTNNGPGRNQVSQKIDLNRSFPTYFKAQYNSRNYTGSTPLAAPEAKALASLVDQYSSSSSHMDLVDVHGWLNQTIGDPSLGQAFDSNFGISNQLMSTAAQGYLISYAHSKGALVSLLELPMPSSSASIQNNGYANKIYNSVNSIIKNGDGFEKMDAEGQVVNTNSLNIRITTSTNSNIIGSYSSGTKVKILGRIGDWYQVNSSAGYGYVHKNYINILSNNTNNSGSNSGSVEAPSNYQIGNVSNISTSLNIRRSASTSSGVITALGKGAEVKVVGEEGDWYKVYSESFGYGYAHKNYITIQNNNNNDNNNNNNNNGGNQESSKQTGTIVNISTTLNVRSGASTGSRVVGTLRNGANITIVGQEGNWYKIEDSSFGTGYVYGDYVKIGGSSESQPSAPDTSSDKTGQVVDVSTKLNVRSGAGTNYGIVGTLAANATVNILGQEGSWYKVSCNGVTGYVSSSYIRVNDNNGNNNSGSSEKYGKVVDVSTKLNVRRSASTSSSIVGTLSNDTKVTILEKTNGWYKISYYGIEGYVSASYIAEI